MGSVFGGRGSGRASSDPYSSSFGHGKRRNDPVEDTGSDDCGGGLQISFLWYEMNEVHSLIEVWF